jgi:peptidyl-prolyl cis-trans isomerase C
MSSLTPRRLAVILAGLAAALPAYAQNNPTTATTTASSKPVTVNGVQIPKARIDAIVKAQEAQGAKDSPELRAAITDRLIINEVVAQEATRKGLAKSPEVQAQLELVRQNVLLNAYRQDFIKTHPIPDAQLRAEYDKIRSQVGDKEYKARHILVEKEDDAKAIVANLKKGQKFEDLAKQSKDPGSKDKGGELDWNSPGSYVKPFSDALVKLEKGKYTEVPVQTQFGWHVILLEDVRPTKFPSFDEVKPQLTERMQAQALEKNVADLRAKAKIDQ